MKIYDIRNDGMGYYKYNYTCVLGVDCIYPDKSKGGCQVCIIPRSIPRFYFELYLRTLGYVKSI